MRKMRATKTVKSNLPWSLCQRRQGLKDEFENGPILKQETVEQQRVRSIRKASFPCAPSRDFVRFVVTALRIRLPVNMNPGHIRPPQKNKCKRFNLKVTIESIHNSAPSGVQGPSKALSALGTVAKEHSF